tara:strand:+ start:1608 stop:2324 length:717 start_codon:yes stop_codon:yes gene_type:complete
MKEILEETPNPLQIIENLPSFSRFKFLIEKIDKASLPRALQNELIENYSFKGDLLDFGGGENSHNRSIIKCNTYQSINIDPNIKPTWVVGADDPFPCDDECFDHIFSFNTLEHIYNAHEKLSEFYRVLKPNGDILISTPFLYPIHGHPDDFFRPTPSWYYMALKNCGFKEIRVVPLFWGPFSTGLTTSGIVPFQNIRKKIALFLDLLLIKYKQRKLSKNEIERILMPTSTVLAVQATK